MDSLKHIITAVVLEAAMEMMRQENRRMVEQLRINQVELRVKAKECEMLKRKKQSLLANEATKQKLVDDFMFFIEAVEKNDVEAAALGFDEEAMMNAILAMMDGEGGQSGDNGGFAAGVGKI